MISMGRTILAVGCAGMMAACSSPVDPPMPAPTGEAQLSCGAQIGNWAIGERDTAAVRARLLSETGAGTIRLLSEETAGTMDHRPDRLNIRVGPNNSIRRLSCG